jgi:RNA polymerase sigma-70 factor (ECF subfamily)
MTTVGGEAPQELIPTRQSLLGRLRDLGDEASWKDFFETYWRLMYRLALKAGCTDAEAQEVVQETVIEVCRKMPRFRYDPKRGSFKRWLLNLTRWRIVDQLRRRQRQTHQVSLDSLDDAAAEELETEMPVVIQELEQTWEEEWQGNLLAAAVQRVKDQVDARQFQIFDLCVIQEWPVRSIVKTLKVSRGQVYLARHRVSSRIKRELRRLEQQPLPAQHYETTPEK